MSKICDSTSIPYHMETFPENESVNLKRVEELLKGDNYSLVSCVHCETSSGVFNPVEQVGQLVKSLSPGTLGKIIPLRTYMHMCAHIYIHKHMHTYTSTHAHSHTHTHTHTRTHTKGVVLLSICRCQFLHLAAHPHPNLTVCKQIFCIIFYNFFPLVRSVTSNFFRVFLTSCYKGFILSLPHPHPHPIVPQSVVACVVYFFCLHVAYL